MPRSLDRQLPNGLVHGLVHGLARGPIQLTACSTCGGRMSRPLGRPVATTTAPLLPRLAVYLTGDGGGGVGGGGGGVLPLHVLGEGVAVREGHRAVADLAPEPPAPSLRGGRSRTKTKENELGATINA